MVYIYSFKATAAIACALLLAAPPIAHKVVHPNIKGYGPVASQEDRAVGKNGYQAFPNFPHIELVQEGSGTPNTDLTGLVSDAELSQLIEKRTFSSLQVRNFAPRVTAASINGANLVIPFTLSLKQYANVLQQGTLDLSGILTVSPDGKMVSASIEQFYDSNFAERVGRMYWLHERDNLHFAQAIAESQLTHWLTKDPARLQKLIQMADREGYLSKP